MAIIMRAFKSKRFVITFCLLAIFRILDLLPASLPYMSIENGKVVAVFDIVSMYSLTGISMFDLIILMVPVLTYSSAFCDDYESNSLTYMIMRYDRSRYCTNTVIACALSSFVACIVGEVIAIGAFALFIPFYEFHQYAGLTYMEAILSVVFQVLLLSLRGAFYGVITMLLSVFTGNKFVIYSIPTILYFFFMYFVADYLKFADWFNPAFLFRVYIFGPGTEVKSLIYVGIYIMVIMYITSKLMCKRIERCY